MESLKEKFNITKNTLFDWSIIERKTNNDDISEDLTDIKTKEVNSELNLDSKKTTIYPNLSQSKEIKLENDLVSNSIKIEITDIKQHDNLDTLDNTLNINKILETESEDNIISVLKVIESKNSKINLHNIDKLNDNLNNLIDKISQMTSTIELLEKKIKSLNETSKDNNQYQSKLLTQPYLGSLNYPLYNFYLHNCTFDDNNNNTSLSSLDEIANSI
tara:strand:+ start:2777 stop:3427 length:651 start_codon:yes stop_codon:yes gene_type:complete